MPIRTKTWRAENYRLVEDRKNCVLQSVVCFSICLKKLVYPPTRVTWFSHGGISSSALKRQNYFCLQINFVECSKINRIYTQKNCSTNCLKHKIWHTYVSFPFIHIKAKWQCFVEQFLFSKSKVKVLRH